MLGLIIFLALWGLVVGALARLALPGPDPMSIWMTIALGLAGSFIGGLLAGMLWHRSAGFVFSVLVSTGLVYLYRRHTRGQGLTSRRL
jgi:uncharacterized membrane protein YeaQ/YmgE (transglycosylase-associated protein family)